MAITTTIAAKNHKLPKQRDCEKKWVLTAIQPMDFGGFAIESGSGSVRMNNLGGRTTTGLISLSTSTPATAFMINVDNTKHAICATFGFSLKWKPPPSPLVGPGTTIPLTNVRVTIPAYGLTDVTLPQTIAANPGNTIPFTMTIYGDIAVASPQTPGLYTSPQFTVEFKQGKKKKKVSSTASATSFAPISIIETTPMNFGTVAGGPMAGTILLGTGGGRIATGGAQTLAAGPGNAASFQVSGEPNQTYGLLYTDGILANASGQQMSVTTFIDNSLGTLPGTGSETFQVGATLNTGPSQPAGLYSTANAGGSPYFITVNYN